MLKLYGDRQSGNCYKPRLLMRLLGVPFEWVEIDVPAGATRTPEFLAMNPNGRVPLLEIEPGLHRAESNAMLYWPAGGTPWLPAGRPDDRKRGVWGKGVSVRV